MSKDIWEHPLHKAVINRDFDKARSLLKAGHKLDDIIDIDSIFYERIGDKFGDTLLHYACDRGDLDTVNFYLENDCPRTLHAFDDIAYTPLIMAAAKGHKEIVIKLLAIGLSPNDHCEEMIGNTALREAVYGGHVEIVEVLLEAGGDPTIPGWMQLSAIDQAYDDVEGGLDGEAAIRIQEIFKPWGVPDWYKEQE